MRNVVKTSSIKRWIIRRMGGVPLDEIMPSHQKSDQTSCTPYNFKPAEIQYLLNTIGIASYLLSNQNCIKRYGQELWGLGNGFRRISQNSDRAIGPHAILAIKSLHAETSSDFMSLCIALSRIVHFNLDNVENEESLFHPDGTKIWDEELLEKSRLRAELVIQGS